MIPAVVVGVLFEEELEEFLYRECSPGRIYAANNRSAAFVGRQGKKYR